MNDTSSNFVYILAHTRRGPYYIDVANSVSAAHGASNTISHEYAVAMGKDITDPARLVWYEACESKAAALARAAAIRKWPIRWQRQLIESQNPEWWEQSQVYYGMPKEYWRTVPEIAPTLDQLAPKTGAHDTEQP